MKLIFCFCLFLFFSKVSLSQHIWVANATSDATSESMDIVMDDAGNSYITGYISGDTEFQNIQIDINLGYSDAIVAKINPQGQYVWVKRFNGPLSDKGIKIVLTSTNEIVITGTYYDNITFGSTTLNAVNNSKDIFLAKLTNDGDVIWARSDGGALGDNPYGLALDSQDNIILTGQFEGTSTIGPNTFTSMLDPTTNLRSFDMFLAKYDSNGVPLWSKAAYAEYEDRGLGVVCDNADNIYLCGQFSDTIDFFGQTVNNQIYNAGFVSKFSAGGTYLWFDKLAASQVLAYDIALDNQGKIVVTGDFLGQLVIWHDETQAIVSNPYDKKIFVLKLTQNGGYIWGRAKGSNSEVSSRTVCIDSQDNIYIGGHFKCNFDEYRDSTGTAHWQSVGFRDQYVTKFTTNGATVWKNQVGGQKEDQCWGIAIHEDDYPIITGSYQKNIIFPFKSTFYYISQLSNTANHEYFNNYDNENDNVRHCYTEGDESINIYLAKMLHNKSEYFNYYLNNGLQIHDSLPIQLSELQDSVVFCPPDRVCVVTQTSSTYGPLYSGQWNNGTQWNNCVSNTSTDGTYSVLVQRQDQCYNFNDTIYIDYKPNPTFPLLSDSKLVNQLDAQYEDIIICYPDSVNFNFTNLCSNCLGEIKINYVTKPFAIDSNYTVHNDNNIIIKITNEFGCNLSQDFNIISIQTINPFLKLADNYDFNDSIMICKDNNVSIIIGDLITNPLMDLLTHTELVDSSHSTVMFGNQYVSSSTGGKITTVFPTNSGWHTLTQYLRIGQSPCEQVFNLTYSFYIEIKENPEIVFIGGDLLCPDTYNYLTYSPIIPNATWYGDSILWTSDDGDSIKLNESGLYGISGSYDYGEVTCPFNNSVQIDEKEPPLIIMNPIDGLVCPGDSVHLWLSETGSAYEWIGPEGNTLSTNPDIYDDDQGFYACIFTDNDGCQLLTAQAEIREYTTPFIIFDPNNFICNFEPINLTAIYGGAALLNWHSPINSNQATVTINQPGTYVCDVTQCGFTVTDSITIIDGSFNINLTSESINLCFGDSILLTSTDGLLSYQWSNGTNSLNSSLYVLDSGTYYVSALNQYGCTDTSNSITITTYPESYPPIVSSVFVCVGENTFVTHTPNSYNFGWYNSTTDTNPFSTADTLFFNNVQNDIIVYAANQSANCPLNFTEVLIDVLFPLTPPLILGDTTVCIGEDIVLSVNQIPNGSYFWIYNNDTIGNNPTVTIPNFNTNSPTLVEIYIEDGCTNTINSTTIELMFPSPIAIDITSDTLCFGENLISTVTGNGNLNFYWTDGTNTWTSPSINISYFDLLSNQVTVFGINADDCHSDTLSIDLTFSPDLDLNVNIDTITCFGTEILLQTNDSLQNLTWTLPSGQTINSQSILIEALNYIDSGLYIVQGFNQYNCLIDDSLNLSVLNLPEFNLGNDSILCAENVYEISLPNLGYQFYWNGSLLSNNIMPTGYEPIIIEALNTSGCHFFDTISIQLVDCSGQAMNFITPNGDGKNDYFQIFNAQYSYDNCIIILNRWGNVVYEEKHYRNQFNGYTNDGKQLNDGVYFFLYYKNCEKKSEVTHQGCFHIFSKE